MIRGVLVELIGECYNIEYESKDECRGMLWSAFLVWNFCFAFYRFS